MCVNSQILIGLGATYNNNTNKKNNILRGGLQSPKGGFQECPLNEGKKYIKLRLTMVKTKTKIKILNYNSK